MLLSAAILCSTTAALAQAAASDGDKHFVDAALKGGMAEVELGKLAADKGASEDVKQFGQRMVADHEKLGEKMKTVAGEIGVTPPTMTTPSDMAKKAELEVLSGKSFDDAYIKAMLNDHQQDLDDFKKEVADGSSPAVKRAARQGETVISEHLALIRKIAAAHNVTAANEMKKPDPRGL
jgi:putative membrane protein